MIYHTTGFGDGEVLNQLPANVTHVFALVLNPMRGRAEESRMLAVSESAAELTAFVEAERVEPYPDGEWQRSFRQGGPLEWFNPAPLYGTDSFGHGIIELRKDGWRRVG